ncbi:hypothetical protein [Rufibacter soli]
MLSRALFTLLLFFWLSSVYAQKWIPPVPLVANAQLQSIAKLSYHDSLKTYVIEFNPELAQQVGPFVTAFHQAHEYGHLQRGHVNKKKLNKQGTGMLQLNQDMEIGADIYATEYLYLQDKSILLSMLDYLHTSAQEDLLHYPRKARAHRLDQHLQTLSAYSTQNVACRHKLHYEDESACTHLSSTGRPLHGSDVTPCLHVTHPEGDNVKVRNQ